MAGLCGLRGVIKKIGHQDVLPLNIWDIDHMNKIVPPFLFNMQDSMKLVVFVCVEHIRCFCIAVAKLI